MRFVAAVMEYLRINNRVNAKGELSLGRIDGEILGDIAERFHQSEEARKAKAAKKPRPRFIPPTPEEVTAYAKSIGYELDGENFCLSYEKKEWCTSGTTKMRNWQAAVKQWRHNGYSDAKVPQLSRAGFASLGALRLELNRVEEELLSILHPGGSALKQLPEAGTAKHARAIDLEQQRLGLKKQIRLIALGTAA